MKNCFAKFPKYGLLLIEQSFTEDSPAPWTIGVQGPCIHTVMVISLYRAHKAPCTAWTCTELRSKERQSRQGLEAQACVGGLAHCPSGTKPEEFAHTKPGKVAIRRQCGFRGWGGGASTAAHVCPCLGSRGVSWHLLRVWRADWSCLGIALWQALRVGWPLMLGPGGRVC